MELAGLIHSSELFIKFLKSQWRNCWSQSSWKWYICFIICLSLITCMWVFIYLFRSFVVFISAACITLTVTVHSGQFLSPWHLSQHLHTTVLTVCLIFMLLQRKHYKWSWAIILWLVFSNRQYAICSNVFSDRLLVIFPWPSA